jgi:hypothetical protein
MPVYTVTKDLNSITIKRVNSIEEIETMTQYDKKFSLHVFPEGAVDLVYKSLTTDSNESQNKIMAFIKEDKLTNKPTTSKNKDKSKKIDHYNYNNSKNRSKIGKISFNKEIEKWEIKGQDVATIRHKYHGWLINYAKRAGMIIEE